MLKLLIAIRPTDRQMMSDALGSEFDVRVCTSLEEAQASLQEDIDAISCGLHFDDGRMFDLLRYAKGNPKTSSIPFFCIKGAAGDLSPAILQSIEIATTTMGANGFLDVSEWRKKFGDEKTYDMLRSAIRKALSKGPSA